MPLPVGTITELRVDDGWESTLVVVPSSGGSGRPVGWLNTKSDGCVVDANMLDTERSPIVFVRNAAEPAFLLTKSEVFSLAVLAGGVVAVAAPLAVVGTVTARVCPTGCWELTSNRF